MTSEEKQKIIEQIKQIAIDENGCDYIACYDCVLGDMCEQGDEPYSHIYARCFLAGIAFEKDEVKEKIKNPCIECGKEFNPVILDECPHCGNVVPF